MPRFRRRAAPDAARFVQLELLPQRARRHRAAALVAGDRLNRLGKLRSERGYLGGGGAAGWSRPAAAAVALVHPTTAKSGIYARNAALIVYFLSISLSSGASDTRKMEWQNC